MKPKLLEQLNEIQNWAFSVAGMVFICFIPIVGVVFCSAGLVQAWNLFRFNKNENRNLLVFALIGTVLALFVATVSFIFTYQEIISSYPWSSSV
jgi:hypothetical protein